jgi:outer membrane protein assembly factor BamB
VGAAIGGLVGAFIGIKASTLNANFAKAGAVDGRTHKLLWSFEAGALIDRYAVVLEDRRLYVGSHDDHIYALDIASGKRLWHRDMGGNISGLVASPKEVIAVSPSKKIRAFAPADGSVVWEKELFVGGLRENDQTVYVDSRNDHVYALDRHTGEQRWNYAARRNPSLRAIVQGLLLVQDKKALVALDVASGKVRWRYDGIVLPEPLIDLGPAIAMMQLSPMQTRAEFFALDVGSGALRWSVNLERLPIDKDRKIYVPEDLNARKRSVGTLRDETGQIKALYLADRKTLRSIRASDGQTLWSIDVPATQLIYVSGQRVLVADKDMILRSIDVRTGAEKWRHQSASHISQLERLGDVLFATLSTKDLVVLDFATGAFRGKFHLGDPFRLVPMEGDRLIVCSTAGTWIMAQR